MDAQAKQQIVERVKQATNILVTVSANPSVDQLSACIGLTLLLNKMGKHATAVFSGKVPSTLEFLQPEKTIETNTNSLQDFIISLDKNKADKLRYKVEDKVVRIFITPYRTSLSQKDLIFSQGDFNVEVVMALGIKERGQIDQAIAAHGRILHDATVISVNAGAGNTPQLGQMNWQEPASSSLCEMLVSISEAFGTGLIDNQMATAFLTGIVAETHRFSNNRTSPKVMTMAAQLMAAGANQQLIVSKLEPVAPLTAKVIPAAPKAPEPKAAAPPTPEPAKPAKDGSHGSLDVPRGKTSVNSPEVEISPNEILIDKQGNLLTPESRKGKHEKVITPPEPAEAPASGHALLGPENHQTSMGAPFSADMQKEWIDPYGSSSLDPLADGPNSEGLRTRPDESAAPADNVDSARGAVQSALQAAPFNPGFAPPVDALNAQPVAEALHADQSLEATPGDTPSLSLPSGTNGTMSASKPYSPPADEPAPAAPPPVPPPLPLSSNPGAMLPNSPTFKPPA